MRLSTSTTSTVPSSLIAILKPKHINKDILDNLQIF